MLFKFSSDDTLLHQSNVSGKVSASREQSGMSLLISYAEAPPELAAAESRPQQQSYGKTPEYV